MESSLSELVTKVHDLKRQLEEASKELKERLDKEEKNKEQNVNKKLEVRSQYITRGEFEDAISSFEKRIRELSIGIDGSSFAPYTESNSRFN